MVRKILVNLSITLAILVTSFAVVRPAFACKEGKKCEEAPGQVAKVETDPVEESVDVAPNGFDNGGADWKVPDENGVVVNPGGQGGVVVVVPVTPAPFSAPVIYVFDTTDLPANNVVTSTVTLQENAGVNNTTTTINTAASNVAIVSTTTIMKTDTKPSGADCSGLQGETSVPLPESEWINGDQLSSMIHWDWKDGPTGGRNRIRATNVCISNGGSGQWTNNLSEPANSKGDRASKKKLDAWALLFNAGQLVVNP